MNYTVIGDTVNLASRLCSAARPGEIIISESVHMELKGEHQFLANEDLTLKGKRSPVKNWKFTHSHSKSIKTHKKNYHEDNRL